MTPKPRRRVSRTIPAELHQAVLERLASTDPDTRRPYTTRAVSRWLYEAHGVRATYDAVQRLFAATQEHGDRLLVAALRDELRDAVGPAKRRLVQATVHLAELCQGEDNTAKLAAGVRALTAALHEIAHLGGVAAPVTVDVLSGGRPITLLWPDAPDHHDPTP